MKTLIFGIFTFAAQAQAIVLGFYECTTEVEGDEAHYGLIIESDRLEIFIDHEVPNDVYMLGGKQSPFANKLVTAEDAEQGIESIEYKFFQQNLNTLRLMVRMFWIDGETEHDLTISQESDNTLEIYNVETAQGEKSMSVDSCELMETF